ncbi:unnamed protein product [Porites evermanni]|uniref:Uncharacterized protein n=1 Tax=Porites evermanni TaxID=104178 RepID=A0ABN8SQU1_9CNID|nr:unnamed protein product [Porites evermanni]
MENQALDSQIEVILNEGNEDFNAVDSDIEDATFNDASHKYRFCGGNSIGFKYSTTGLQGTYRGMTRNGLVFLSVDSTSGFVKYLPTVKHLNPPVTRNMEGPWYISIFFPKENTMIYGKKYRIHFLYKGGRLRFTAV